MMAFDWDCDCGWEIDVDKWNPPPPPPLFNVPPPPLPPALVSADGLCSAEQLGETCQAFLVSDPEYQVPESVPSMAVIVISAAILTAVIIIASVLLWRYVKHKKQNKIQRCQKNAPAAFDVPALRVEDEGTDDGVLYDELLSFPTHFRTNHNSIPPSYEMRDVLKSPCQCTTHPLLNNSQHYVTSLYHSSSPQPILTQQPQQTLQQQSEEDNWVTEPVYEELPSGPEDDAGRSSSCSRDHRTSPTNHGRSLRGGANGGVQGPYRDETREAGETDFFLTPSWYQHQGQGRNLVRGQLVLNGPVKRGEGGVRAAWRELPSDTHHCSHHVNSSRHSNGRKKRKIKSKSNAQDDQNDILCTNPIMGLYQGKCPPEPPPFSASDERNENGDDVQSNENTNSRTTTLPRYYYYSESDDYGVSNPTDLHRQRSLNSRRSHQRHLYRNTRNLRPSPSNVS